MRSNQNGNVLFLILIAVALFAALSYAVTSSSRSGGNNVSKEKTQTSVARILNYETSLRSAVTKIIQINAVASYQLKFNNNIHKQINGTLIADLPTIPADQSLYVFLPQGGGIVPETFEDLAETCSACPVSYMKPGHMNFFYVNTPGIGTSESDLSAYIAGIKQEICLGLNNANGIGIIPELVVNATSAFNLTARPAVVATTGSTADMSAIQGHSSFCYRESATPFRYIYRVIFESY